MRRRTFLHHALGLSAGAACAVGASRVWAASQEGPRLLLVFLRGGYDALGLLSPSTNAFYQEVRPHIAVPAATAATADQPGLSGAVPWSDGWHLHPLVADALAPLISAGQLCFVPFAGTDDLSRSHFETQDSIELGQPLGGQRDFQSGFMNRLAAALPAGSGMAFTNQLPVAFRGPTPVLNTALGGGALKPLPAPMQSGLSRMYEHHPLGTQVREAFEVRREAAMSMEDEMQASGRNAISAGGFEQEARRMARLMRGRHALGFVDVGGWDTHVGQGGLEGNLPSRLRQLALGLAGFADTLGPQAWRQTTVVVISEFGRTFRENGNRGTDHGHGTVYWVLGGGLKGLKVAGEQVAIGPQTLFQNRDLPVLNDHRAVLGGLMRRQFDLSNAALQSVFPGVTPQDLGILA